MGPSRGCSENSAYRSVILLKGARRLCPTAIYLWLECYPAYDRISLSHTRVQCAQPCTVSFVFYNSGGISSSMLRVKYFLQGGMVPIIERYRFERTIT